VRATPQHFERLPEPQTQRCVCSRQCCELPVEPPQFEIMQPSIMQPSIMEFESMQPSIMELEIMQFEITEWLDTMLPCEPIERVRSRHPGSLPDADNLSSMRVPAFDFLGWITSRLDPEGSTPRVLDERSPRDIMQPNTLSAQSLPRSDASE
jgi:hypothetical protein